MIATLVGQFVNSYLFFKIAKYLKNPEYSRMKFIQHIKGGLAHHLVKYGANLLARFVFTTHCIFVRASLLQEKSQSTDFASSTRMTGMICNIFCDYIV